MTANGWLQIAFFFVLLLLAAKPLGLYMARVYERQKTPLDPALGPVTAMATMTVSRMMVPMIQPVTARVASFSDLAEKNF